MAEFAYRVAVATGVVLAMIVVLLLLYTIRLVLVILFIAFILSAAIRPVVFSLERRAGVPRGLAIVLVYLALAFTSAIVILAVAPAILAELVALISNLPLYLEQLVAVLDQVERFLEPYGPAPDLSGQVAQLPSLLLGALDQLVQVPLGILTVLAWFVSIFALALYWLLERDVAIERIVRFAPPRRRERWRRLILRVEDRLGAYVHGELIVSSVIGFLSLAGLLVLGVRYALVLALIAALLEVVPIIGPIIAAIPAVIIAFVQSPPLALAVIAWYVVIQQVEGNLVYPKIQERVIHIPAFFILLALLIGAELMGILGALIAVPAAVAITVIVDELTTGEAPARARPEEEEAA
ncbi:MAG TPA: AI-2E family transporter [Chloroflexota bacterium]